MIEALPDSLRSIGSDPALLGDELLHLIKARIAAHPRSRQKALGPSEIGHPCSRRLGYQLLDVEENEQPPNWKATIGTAVHAWLEQMLQADNDAAGFTRWYVEQKVTVGDVLGEPVDGHCDAFDRVTSTSVDWKVVGPTQLRKYRSHGPGEQYRAQGHSYGRGWASKGLPVENVAVMFLPRNGDLKDAVWWSEPYDEQVAVAALNRLHGITLTTKTLGLAALPALPTADAYCSYCPYFSAGSTDLAAGCPGDPASPVNNTPDPTAPAFGAV